MVKFNKYVVVVSVLFAALFSFAAGLSLSECKERAARGNVEALYQLGVRYENGDGVAKDRIKAVAQYQKAAAKKHPRACLRLAELYETGTFVAKDPAKAAEYRAIAEGESAAEAVADAKKKQALKKTDFIEVALDYLLGRNGKERDAKQGIQILYKAAKDNPTAQRVFVERWEKGDLSEGLSTISEEDWELVIPWFERQFKKGRHKGGLILGNQAYLKKDYEKAACYYRAAGEAGLAKAWLFYGNLYYLDEENGGGPKSMRNDVKAKSAYKKCLRLDSQFEGAEIGIGLISLFSKNQKCIDYPHALKIFKKLMNKHPDDNVYPLWCAFATKWHANDWYYSRWPAKVIQEIVRKKEIIDQVNRAYNSTYNQDCYAKRGGLVSGAAIAADEDMARQVRQALSRAGISQSDYRKIEKLRNDFKAFKEQTQLAAEYALKAVNLGNKDAEEYYNDLMETLKGYQKVTILE